MNKEELEHRLQSILYQLEDLERKDTDYMTERLVEAYNLIMIESIEIWKGG